MEIPFIVIHYNIVEGKSKVKKLHFPKCFATIKSKKIGEEKRWKTIFIPWFCG